MDSVSRPQAARPQSSFRAPRAFAVILLSTCLAPASPRLLQAQGASLLDQVRTLSTSGGAASLRSEAEALGQARDMPTRMRRAVFLLRAAQLTGRRQDWEGAASAFQSLASDSSQYADAWFGLGLVRTAMGDSGFLAKAGPLQPEGASLLDGAAYAYLRALALDSTLVAAAESLSMMNDRPKFHLSLPEFMPQLVAAVSSPPGNADSPLLLRVARLQSRYGDLAGGTATYQAYLRAGGDTVALTDTARTGDDRETLESLREGTSEARPLPELLLRRLRLEADLEHTDSLRAVLRRYRDVGGDSGAADFFEARLRWLKGDTAAMERSYYEGARHAGAAAARSLYREDIGWVASPEELARFDALPGPDLTGWLQGFWQKRDVADARPPGSRLREQFRRYFYAMEHYRLTPRARKDTWWTVKTAAPGLTGETEDPALGQNLLRGFQSSQNLFDDRGVVYLRHGAPDQIQLEMQESSGDQTIGGATVWRYFRPSGDLILQFADVPNDGTAGDVALARALVAPNALCAMQGGRACAIAGGASPATFRDYQAVDGRLSRDVDVATTTDDYRPHFDKSFTPLVQLYAVGSVVPGEGTLLAVFAVPGNKFPRRNVPQGGVVYPLHLRLSAAAADGRDVASVDTTRYFVTPKKLGKGQYLTGFLSLRVPPGIWQATLSVADSAERIGTAVRSDSLQVPALNSGELTMSDLILGQLPATLVWHTNGEVVPLNPLNAWSEHGGLSLYYELGGLRPGATYRTAIEFRQEDKTRLAVRFEEQATGTRQSVRRNINLADLKRGDYWLVLSVRDEAGHTIQRRQRVAVH